MPPANSIAVNEVPIWTRRRFLVTAGCALLGFQRVVASSLPPIRIAFYTDVHAMPGLTDEGLLARAAWGISNAGADAIVAGGDSIHRGHVSPAASCIERFALYKTFLGQLPPGVEHVPGNHDLAGARPEGGEEKAADPWELWQSELGISAPSRAFDRAGYRFLVLDTLELPEAGPVYIGRAGSERLQWLPDQVAATPADMPIILCLHIPVLSDLVERRTPPGEVPSPSLLVTDANEIFAAFGNRPPVAVLQGHLHVKERNEWHGVPVLTGGAVAGAWWKGSNENTPPGYALIEIRDGRLRWEYIVA